MAKPEPKSVRADEPAGELKGVRVAHGLEQVATSEAEVSGRTFPGAWYICRCDAADNWAPAGWNYAYCFQDGCLNFI